MWKCPNCSKEILFDIKYPVRCSCGIITYNDGTYSSYTLDHLIEENKPASIKKLGPELWKELHLYQYTTEEEAKKFLKNWQNKIPVFGCDCVESWAKIIKKYPPNFSSVKGFFEWGVVVHNKVNEKLGKPVISLEEAKKVYNIVLD